MKNIMTKKNTSLLIIPVLMGISLYSYAAGTTVTHTFSASTAARASEVNQNFSDVVSGVNALETSVNKVTSGTTNLTIDCDSDPDVGSVSALQNAVNTATLGTLDITVTGSCDPIAITRDHVKLSGGATITSDGSAPYPSLPVVAAVVVVGAQNVSIDGITMVDDGADSGALTLGNGASATVSNSSISGTSTENYAVNIFSNSTLFLTGGVSISGASGIAVEQSSALIEYDSTEGSNANSITGSGEEAVKTVGGSTSEFNSAITLTGNLEIDTSYVRGEALTVTGTVLVRNGGTLSLRDNNTHLLDSIELTGKSSAELEKTTVTNHANVFGSVLVLEISSSVGGTTSLSVGASVYIDSTSSLATTNVRQSSLIVDGTVGALNINTYASAVIGYGDAGGGTAAIAKSGITVTDSNLLIWGSTDTSGSDITTKTPSSTATINNHSTGDNTGTNFYCENGTGNGTWIGASCTVPAT